MFNKLKQRWKVSMLNLVLIICTFATGGSLCGYLGRRILNITSLERGFVWIVLYILLITLLWPLCVLLISIPLGQLSFFKKYLKRLFNRMRPNNKTSIAIFASGAGSNAAKIIDHFNTATTNPYAKVDLVVYNKKEAGVVQIAGNARIDTLFIEKEQFLNGDGYVPVLKAKHIDLIILAGFLWKVPRALIDAYPNKIINIHPALLPKYGGKGMYGAKVHEAVVNNKEAESGITIHYVDELYDHGNHIFQATCTLEDGETPDSLAAKVHQLEHLHYPSVIENLLKNAK